MSAEVPSLAARVRRVDDKSERATKLLAFAELTIGGSFCIKGIRLLRRADEGADEPPFVVFPAERRVNSCQDRWYDVAHPVTSEARAAAVAVILAEYARPPEAP